jgi:hypothetical protein
MRETHSKRQAVSTTTNVGFAALLLAISLSGCGAIRQQQVAQQLQSALATCDAQFPGHVMGGVDAREQCLRDAAERFIKPNDTPLDWSLVEQQLAYRRLIAERLNLGALSWAEADYLAAQNLTDLLTKETLLQQTAVPIPISAAPMIAPQKQLNCMSTGANAGVVMTCR